MSAETISSASVKTYSTTTVNPTPMITVYFLTNILYIQIYKSYTISVQQLKLLEQNVYKYIRLYKFLQSNFMSVL